MALSLAVWAVHSSAIALAWHWHGSSMAPPWHCHGGQPWHCHGCVPGALPLQGTCNVVSALFWRYNGSAHTWVHVCAHGMQENEVERERERERETYTATCIHACSLPCMGMCTYMCVYIRMYMYVRMSIPSCVYMNRVKGVFQAPLFCPLHFMLFACRKSRELTHQVHLHRFESMRCLLRLTYLI